MTIFAARRVLPPDLIVPALASAPRMKDTGPLAVPPPPRGSLEERILDRLMPLPDPPLKIVPSSTYQLRMEDIVSSTARMKHALHWAGTSGTPTLNHTGELNAAFWVTSRWVSSSAKTRSSSAESKYLSLAPHPRIVSTTRPISCRTLDSRWGVSRGPRKYFWATMFVAFCDQPFGNSTPRCSKALPPDLKFGMTASRVSHSTSSNGCAPSVVKDRLKVRPVVRTSCSLVATVRPPDWGRATRTTAL